MCKFAVKLGIGGFSMGSATSLYSATCAVEGKFRNGNAYPVNLSAVVGLSGWLPMARTLKNKVEGSQEGVARAASLPLLLCHGKVHCFLGFGGFKKQRLYFPSCVSHLTALTHLDP
ncbi:hypothetical protein MKX03_036084 [Papaver bracteatum]|nr:hypothetical protein MKX03_036084 [Papaver bracteatum]